MKRMIAAGLLVLGGTVATAQTAAPPAAIAPAPILTQRAAALLPILNGGGVLADVLDPTILAAVPEPQFRAVSKQLSDAMGRAVAVTSVEARSPTQAVVKVKYERGEATFGMAVAATAPGKIIGLRVLGAEPAGAAETTLPAVVGALDALPGETSFALADLGAGAPRLVQSLAPDRPMALGSEFKLVILATLVAEVEAGRRRWDDLVTLDGTERPGGGYNGKPAGTRVTLRELARQMISVSDNSATDILTDMLGRQRIEAMQATVGWQHPERNRPWLNTMELFKLKGVGAGALGARYLRLDERGRRAMLAGEVARTPGSAVGNPFASGKPVRIKELEWFASAGDMVRVMDWLRRHSESGPGAEARAILSVNPGIFPAAAQRFAFVGYKGGSEPGVMTMTLLLQTRAGQWRVISAAWNNPAAAVDETRFALLVNRAAELAAE